MKKILKVFLIVLLMLIFSSACSSYHVGHKPEDGLVDISDQAYFIKVEVNHLSATILEITYSNITDVQLFHGESYIIQKLIDEEWETINAEQDFLDVGHILNPEESWTTWPVEIKELAEEGIAIRIIHEFDVANADEEGNLLLEETIQVITKIE